MSKMDILKIVAEKTSLSVADNLSFNLASAIKNSVTEIAEYTKITNDALYHLQVKTFLETVELDQDEVKKFLEDSKDNYRLSLEIFKILEKTYLEKQAIYIAKAFRKFLKREINITKFHEYVYVIEQLSEHILMLIEEDLDQLNSFYTQHEMKMDLDEEIARHRFLIISVSSKQPLQAIGFVYVEPKEQEIKLSSKFKQKMTYIRSNLYLDFYTNILKEG